MKKIKTFVLVLCLFSATATFAQQLDLTLPDSPGTVSTSGPASDVLDQTPGHQGAGQQPGAHQDLQQKRIFGILPNFRAVSPGAVLPPQTVKDKLVTASQDSFDYSAFLLTFAVAAYGYGTNQTPEFGGGGLGFSRYLWHTYADQTSENFLVEFIVPAVTHEDTRYYTMGTGGAGKRLVYSISRTFITRTDSGKRRFNAGEIIGSGASAGLSNLYYPGPERTLGNTLDKWGTSVGIDTVSFMLKEFSPDLYHAFFHPKHSSMATP